MTAPTPTEGIEPTICRIEAELAEAVRKAREEERAKVNAEWRSALHVPLGYTHEEAKAAVVGLEKIARERDAAVHQARVDALRECAAELPDEAEKRGLSSTAIVVVQRLISLRADRLCGVLGQYDRGAKTHVGGGTCMPCCSECSRNGAPMTFMRPIVFSSADVVERRVAEAYDKAMLKERDWLTPLLDVLGAGTREFALEAARRVVAERDAAREDWRREREAHGIAIQNANESVKRAEAAEARVQESEADYGRERQRADTYQLRCDQAEARVRELERILDENIANLGSRDAELARVRAELAETREKLSDAQAGLKAVSETAEKWRRE